jgi:hypothetical protein
MVRPGDMAYPRATGVIALVGVDLNVDGWHGSFPPAVSMRPWVCPSRASRGWSRGGGLSRHMNATEEFNSFSGGTTIGAPVAAVASLIRDQHRRGA